MAESFSLGEVLPCLSIGKRIEDNGMEKLEDPHGQAPSLLVKNLNLPTT